METYNNHDKLRMIKHYFIFNMLQQPSCFININKTATKNLNDKISTEFIPETQDVIIENDSKSAIPICDKLTMVRFLVLLKLLQRPYHNENMNDASKITPINVKEKIISTPNKLNLFKNSKNKFNTKFMFFIRQVTFKNNSHSIEKESKINTSGDIIESKENKNPDYLKSLIPPPPIIIEEKDIYIDIPIE